MKRKLTTGQYYQYIITEKSWQVLIELKKKIDPMVIGGWAVYLYTRALKSKDIDIIINYDQLDFFKKNYYLNRNDRLKKYQAVSGEIDIDIYLPHFSHLGLPVEKIINFWENQQTFKTLNKEVLLLTKQVAYNERKASIKGQKDKIDIIALILLKDFNFLAYKKFLKEYRLERYLNDLKNVLKETKSLPELDLNEHAMAKKKKEILRKM